MAQGNRPTRGLCTRAKNARVGGAVNTLIQGGAYASGKNRAAGLDGEHAERIDSTEGRLHTQNLGVGAGVRKAPGHKKPWRREFAGRSNSV